MKTEVEMFEKALRDVVGDEIKLREKRDKLQEIMRERHTLDRLIGSGLVRLVIDPRLKRRIFNEVFEEQSKKERSY